MGILFKNSEALENAHRLQVVALDKTGTITRGEPSVTDIIPATRGLSPMSTEELLRLAGSAERGSEHPLGQAVVKAAQEAGHKLSQPEGFEAESGRGIGHSGGKSVLVGSPRSSRAGLDAALTRRRSSRSEAAGAAWITIAG
jgi:Cu+-exporting ATPase